MKYIILFLLFISLQSSFAQSGVGISLGGGIGQLRFTNSEDVVEKDVVGVPGAMASVLYIVGLGVNSGSNLLGVKMGYKSSKFKDVSSSLLTTWDLQFINSQLFFRHVLNSTNKATVFFGGGLAMDHLYGGTQNQGFNQFNVKDDLESWNFSLTAETGLVYTISTDAYATIQFEYLRGLVNLEKDPSQQTLIHGFALSIAIIFNLNGS